MSEEKIKASDVHPTVLRLPPQLRADLMRAATVNGRSLSKEIALRLADSLNGKPGRPSRLGEYMTQGVETPAAGDPRAAYGDTTQSLLTENEAAVVESFRKLPAEKQLGLLALLR